MEKSSSLENWAFNFTLTIRGFKPVQTEKVPFHNALSLRYSWLPINVAGTFPSNWPYPAQLNFVTGYVFGHLCMGVFIITTYYWYQLQSKIHSVCPNAASQGHSYLCVNNNLFLRTQLPTPKRHGTLQVISSHARATLWCITRACQLAVSTKESGAAVPSSSLR